jgi:hypothetical protein
VSAVETRVVHDWRLVAPWWHWPARNPGASTGEQATAAELARRSAPVLQKYDSPDLVNTFLAEPQRRLSFRPGTDEVHAVTYKSKALTSVPTSTPNGLRKLYLGSHHRQYLVVASLHCADPGFPSVDRDGVCQAGFVVRRRAMEVSEEARRTGALLLARLSAARRRRAGAEQQLAAAARAGSGLRLAALEARLSSAAKIDQDSEAALKQWAKDSGIHRQLQGWVPQGVQADGTIVPVPSCGTAQAVHPLPGVGAWKQVAELPDSIEEATFPLYPLVADPTRPGHDATGETIWFGVVPTGSSDVDPGGVRRFDDGSTYEIRCFVRRHRGECPREGPHCSCPAIWSEPTAPYGLAAHLDLEGTANRPVTVVLPDLGRLQADALRLGPGRTAGVRFQAPPASGGAPGLDLPSICSFAIPLLTIVANFVFRLFLPIIVLLSQLWFLLALRFCTPAKDAGGDLDAALHDLDDTEALVTTQFRGEPEKDRKSLGTRMKKGVDADLYQELVKHITVTGPKPPPDREGTAADPVFAPRVERRQVVSP